MAATRSLIVALLLANALAQDGTLEELGPMPGAPPLPAAAAGNAAALLAFAAGVLAHAKTDAKATPELAAQLLAGTRELGDSLTHGAARERWRSLQRRAAARVRAAACSGDGGGGGADGASPQTCEWQPPGDDSDSAPAADGGGEPGTAPEGVLVVAGGVHGLSNAYVLLRALRRVGCRLPVEVVYYGEHEYHAATAQLILGLDSESGGGSDEDSASAAAGGASEGQQQQRRAPAVRLIDGLAYHRQFLEPLAPHRPLVPTGFATKVHALAFVTAFERVLLLDADNMAVQDPTPLFSHPAFLEHGSLFWPDFWTDMWVNLGIYHLLGMPVPWEADPSQLAAEAGQLLVDRVRHYDALEYLWLLATHKEVVGACVWGDKDTYRMAFHLAGKESDYHPVPHPPRQVLGQPGGASSSGSSGGSSSGGGPHPARLHHLGMAQLSPDGASVMFYHRTAAGKLFPHCIHRWGVSLASCTPAWLTLPLEQRQLLASVRDPTDMYFEPPAVDTEWHKAHCTRPPADAAAAAAGGSAAAAAAALPVCGSGWEGARPIPLLPAAHVPALAALSDWVHSEVFLPLLDFHSGRRS